MYLYIVLAITALVMPGFRLSLKVSNTVLWKNLSEPVAMQLKIHYLLVSVLKFIVLEIIVLVFVGLRLWLIVLSTLLI